MLNQQTLEARIEAHLAPYALRAELSRGRPHSDHETPYRALYQRDRDRIVHSWAFRRLQYKTQVFVSVMEGDYYRNRLTHTLEVTQIARTVARALALNEDLTEALALAHDLGHGPFGHSGETALNEVMQDQGGFNHNDQGLRVVDMLEHRYARFPGLNLTYETREGFAKNLTNTRAAIGFAKDESPSLEVQLTNHADEIAYDTHDLEDGLVSGVLTEDRLQEVELWRQTEIEVLSENSSLRHNQCLRWRAIVRRLISKLILDLMRETEERLRIQRIQSVEDVRRCPTALVAFTNELDAQRLRLEEFLHQNFYNNPRVKDKTTLWHNRLKELFSIYHGDSRKLPEEYRRRVESEDETLERVICDYLAGMTDRYATQQWEMLI
ncbi:MAG: deoxyguanosinetriphosphate triphosphohydrolase [Planctomycetota bacterium]